MSVYKMPFSKELEENALGLMMFYDNALASGIDKLCVKDFYIDANAVIFETIFELFEKDEEVSSITVIDNLEQKHLLEKAGGAARISRMIDTPTSTSMDYTIVNLKNYTARRDVISTAQDMIDVAVENSDVEQVIGEAESSILKLAEKEIKHDYVTSTTAVANTLGTIQNYVDKKGELIGLDYGYAELNAYNGGMLDGNLIFLAGRPSMGKSAMALNIGENVAERGNAVLYFSAEMTEFELTCRRLSMKSNVSLINITTGKLNEAWSEPEKLVSASDVIATRPMFIDDTPGIMLHELILKARRAKLKDDIKLIIVDHIGLIRTTMGTSRHLELGEISSALKRLAKELNIPVIALAQLNRGIESREDKRPVLSDLRESGRMEEDADIVAFLYRDDYYNPESAYKDTIEFIIKKNRMGSLGTSTFMFKKYLTKIEEFERLNPFGDSYGEVHSSSMDTSSHSVTHQGFETVKTSARLPYLED